MGRILAEVAMTDESSPAYVEYVSVWSFDLTLEKVLAAIASAGMEIFANIDHAANAKRDGLEMREAVVLIYGNPRGGTPIMVAAPRAALDLPLRVLVQRRGDEVVIAFHPVVVTLVAAGVPADLAKRLEAAQSMLLDILTA